MRTPSRFLTSVGAALLAAASLAPALRSQGVRAVNPDDDRSAATLIVFGDNLLAAVSISYSQPVWKDDYDAHWQELKGKSHRLGRNWWTSLDTTAALDFGGTVIRPGAYYLGLHCDDQGEFSLLVFEADKAMKNGMMPFLEETWKGGTKVPLKLAKGSLATPAAKLTIKLDKGETDPMQATLRVQWGKHELSAGMKIQPGAGGMDHEHGATEAKGTKDQGKGKAGDNGKDNGE